MKSYNSIQLIFKSVLKVRRENVKNNKISYTSLQI